MRKSHATTKPSRQLWMACYLLSRTTRSVMRTQMYTLEVSGYETELQAGKNGNWNKYGSGMMCVGGNMYYIYTEDTEQATWDALKASPPDESKVLVKCLLGEGSSGGGGDDTTSSSMHATVGIVGLLGVVMMA